MKKLLILFSVMAVLMSVKAARAEQTTVSQLNELLKGEISATETYRQALEKVGDVPGASELRKNYTDHENAVATLRDLVMKNGGQPEISSGAWGAWAETVVGSAKLLGDKPALKALKEGEEHGHKEYQEALENKNVPTDIKDKIRSTFVPAQEQHIRAINKLMDNA